MFTHKYLAKHWSAGCVLYVESLDAGLRSLRSIGSRQSSVAYEFPQTHTLAHALPYTDLVQNLYDNKYKCYT